MSDEKELKPSEMNSDQYIRYLEKNLANEKAARMKALIDYQSQLTAARERIEALEDRSKLEKIIKGCLSSTIKAHGPITDKYLQSAAKRISGQIIAALNEDK